MRKMKILLLLTLCTLTSCIQQKESESNDNKDTTDPRTEYYYEDKDNVKYPIYMTETGRAYIIKEKKGRKHKMYLPE